MKKTLLVLAAVILLAGASLQSDSLAYGQRIGIKYDIVVEDDSTYSYLMFNSMFGNYKFIRCSDGSVLSGRGVVNRSGCGITLSDVSDTQKVLATVDECGTQGKASIEVLEDLKTIPAMKELLSDANLRDNTADCQERPKK